MLRFPASRSKIASCFALALTGLLVAASAHGAQRTFVGSQGSDSNSCAVNDPCRSFAAAMANTDANGEIIVLDSAGYGRVTIDRSVSIIAPSGVYAGISVFAGSNGVDVNGAGIVVVLRGLTINGQGGFHGIAFTQGSRLYIEQCVVSNMSGSGIEIVTGETFISDSTIRDNSVNGIRAESAAVRLVIDRSRIERNNGTGLHGLNAGAISISSSVIAHNSGAGGVEIRGDDGASETIAAITDSNINQNETQGISASASLAGSVVRLAVVRSTISGNEASGVFLSAVTGTTTALVSDNVIVRNSANGGVFASGAGVSATISANAISANAPNGVRQQGSAVIKTRANNVVQNNATDISGTLTFVSGD